MKTNDRRRWDWVIITVIILTGFLCLLLAGSLALRFSPSWQLSANMDSNLNPNSDFLTLRPSGFIEPVDLSILTPPAWLDLFLTPGATFPTRQPKNTATPYIPTIPSTSTKSFPVTATATRTFIYLSPTSTSIFIPAGSRTPTRTSAPTSTKTPTPTVTRIYTPTFTHTATSTFTATSTPTATHTVTSTFTATNTATYTPTSTPTSTPSTSVDLQITKYDNASTYIPGGTLTYTVTVTNNGPGVVTGVLVTDAIPAQIVSWTWICATPGNGCSPAANSTIDFTDTLNLPDGASVTYTVTANVSSGATGDLTNSASVSPPSGLNDSVPGNNFASDTDQSIVFSTFPDGNIGPTPDGNSEVLLPGSSVTLAFNTPLIANGDSAYDLVYYELPNGSGIAMDYVIIQISDGYNWYTIFNWGNNSADTNSNLNINVIGGNENDNRDFTSPPASDILYNSTGVVIDVDSIVAPGTYPYIRIISPTPDDGDGCEVDAITLLP